MTATTPPTDPALPSADLVDAVNPRRLGRLAVGTGGFNALAILVLVAISTFVVLSSGHTPNSLAERAGAQETTTSRRTHPTTTSPRSKPAGSSTTTTTKPKSKSKTPTTRPKTVLAATPAKSTDPTKKTATCGDFPDQAMAQAWFDVDPTLNAAMDGDGDGKACELLPGGSTTSVPPTQVASTPKAIDKADLLRPATRLYGVHTAQSPLPSEVSAFSTEAGKAPNMVMFFKDLDDPFPAENIATSWGEGALPMVTLEPIIKNSTTGQPTLDDITNGKYDAQLTAWAQAAATQNMAFVMRFAQEMNGNWYTWSDGALGNSAGDFIPAWRHVHDIFDAAGADQVIWNWSVNRIDTLPNKGLARVYPGDSYVDWVGVSGYYRVDDGTTPSFDNTFAATLAALHQVAPSKLVVLSEVGAGTTETNRVTWINDFFAQLLNHPEIIGFNWFNDFKSGGDWSIGYSTATEQAFRAGVANDRYGPLTR